MAEQSKSNLAIRDKVEQLGVGFGIASEQLNNLFRLAKSYEGRSALQ